MTDGKLSELALEIETDRDILNLVAEFSQLLNHDYDHHKMEIGTTLIERVCKNYQDDTEVFKKIAIKNLLRYQWRWFNK
jgi:hypothetical protein